MSAVEARGLIGPETGDFKGRDHADILGIINWTAELYYKASQTQSIQEYGELQKGLDQYRLRISYPGILSDLNPIVRRYQEADRQAIGKSDEEKIIARVATAHGGLSIVSDLDGTITEDPNAYLVKLIPASRVAEPILKGQRDRFLEVFVRTWHPFLREAPDIFRQGGLQAPLRAGVAEFLDEWRGLRGRDVTILSANFEPFVLGVMAQVGHEDVEVRAVTPNDVTSTDKAAHLTELAHRNPDQALVFIGDGASDEEAVKARDVLAAVLALEGSSFAHQLMMQKVPYMPYRDFHDINAILSRLEIMSRQISPNQGLAA